MSPGAERVKAFCERVVKYEKEYQKYWKNQKGAEREASAPVSEFIALLDKIDKLNGDEKAIEETIRQEKLPYCRAVAKARSEVYDLIMASPLSPMQRRIMIDRYHKAWTWEHTRAMTGYVMLRSVFRLHEQALELMVPVMDEMYPDWQIGDE